MISHVTQTLGSGDASWVIPLEYASDNVKTFVLSNFYYFGVLGNTIFFVCSAWFLADNDGFNKEKEISIAWDVWVVSVIIAICFIASGISCDWKDIASSFLPNMFANNWYLTCYLLFYPMHGYLNQITRGMETSELLKACVVLDSLYMLIGFIHTFFFATALVDWIVIYFNITFIKKYFTYSKKRNIEYIMIGFLCHIFLMCATNIAGLHVKLVSGLMLHWAFNCNPFLVMIAIGIFELVKETKFHNRFINYISSLTLLIYIIHENILIRRYLRPLIWQKIFDVTGLGHEVLLTLIFATVLFVISVLLASIYRISTRRMNQKITGVIIEMLNRCYKRVEIIVLNRL